MTDTVTSIDGGPGRDEDALFVDMAAAIDRIATRAEVLVVRAGLRRLDLAGWQAYLGGSLGLRLDRRHIDDTLQVQHADWWEVSYQPERATSYAFSRTRQPLHTDNAWFAEPADMNFFAMRKQAQSGGAQMVYPVPRLLDDLASQKSGLLDALTSTPVTIRKAKDGYENHTTILVPSTPPRVFWNYYRTVKDTAEVVAMCDEFFTFLEARESTSSVECVQLSTGDCLLFNDSLLLHGRTAFAASRPFERVLLQSMWFFAR